MKNLYEGILGDIEANINRSDDYIILYEYVKCLSESEIYNEDKLTDEELHSVLSLAMNNGVLKYKNGELHCNYDNARKIKSDSNNRDAMHNMFGLLFSSVGININANEVPKSLKKIIYEDLDDLSINLVKTNDISSIDLKLTKPSSMLRIYAADDIHDDIIKLGKVNCGRLRICENNNSSSPDGISIKPGSNIDTLDLSKCKHKGFVLDGLKLNNVMPKDIIINMAVFSNTLKKTGIHSNLKISVE